MANSDRLSSHDDAEKDIYPADSQFGRAAAEDAERAADAGGEEEGSARRVPRAGNKAEPDELDPVDEASADSFPASDPPSSTGTQSGGTA